MCIVILMHRCALAAVLVVVAIGCRSASSAPTQPDVALTPVKVSTVKVEKKPVPRELSLTGTMAAERASDVAADVAGKIVTAPVERGQFVEKGALLAQLDTRNAAISAKEAKASLDLAQAQLDLAKNDCQRAEALYKAGSITGAEYDKIKTQCTTGDLSVTQAEARRDAAAKALGDSAIRAPFAGLVAERFVEAGEYVRADSKVARIVAIDPVRLDLSVPEPYIHYVSQGMTVKFDVSAWPGQVFEAKVKYIGAELREPSRDLLVEAESPNGDQKLRPGMFAVARLELPSEPALVVPKTALRTEGTTTRAFVIKGDHVEERLVELGVESDVGVEIRRGLNENEDVVAPLGADVKDGAPTITNGTPSAPGSH